MPKVILDLQILIQLSIVNLRGFTMKRIICTFLIFITGFVSLFAAYNSLGIPDSAEIRNNLMERWFEAPLPLVRNNLPEYFYNESGQKFKVSMEESEDVFNIYVSPQSFIDVTVVSDKGSRKETQEFFPVDAPGSFVLVKDKKTGKPLRIRYYFLKNSEVYVQFIPKNKTALADFVMFGNYAARGVSTGIPFDYFYTTSIESVIKLTEKKIPWNYVLVDSNAYYDIEQMIGVIREKLPEIKYRFDAMIDEHGKQVYVSSGAPYEYEAEDDPKKLYLSSVGFLKWIGDGIVEPISGGHLKRGPLIAPTVEVKETGHQGILSQNYDLYFSLNWVRNLAAAIFSVYSGSTYLFSESGVDVTTNPFASAITDRGVENIVTFIENSGYSVGVLKSLLYVLSATEPNTFYFGAIRGTNKAVTPEVKAFNECVAFFPYFLSDGAFECAVFLNGKEISLEQFIMLYEDDFVYLTRVKADRQFYPQ